jgi:hypothetical protein
MKYLNIAFLALLGLVSAVPSHSINPIVAFIDLKDLSNMQSRLRLANIKNFEGTVSTWINGDGNCFGPAAGTVTNPATNQCWGLVDPSGNFPEIWSLPMKITLNGIL